MRIHVSAVRGLTIAALLCAAPALAEDVRKETSTDKANKADNTRQNSRDQDGAKPTADQQKNNRSDLETTRQIRRALATDKSLSLYAHNVKIIAQGGTVTLKGPVRTEDEKRIVEKKAAEVAGEANIKSEIQIAPKK